jgi:hypothetical protein
MTAVNYLISSIEEQIYRLKDNRIEISISVHDFMILKEEAKRMEKEQIIIAFDIGSQDENRIGKEYYDDLYSL